MPNTIKDKIINGSFWSVVERFGYLGIQFISNLVLARLLGPNDFGTIGILLVFTTLSSVLIDSGLPSALIQKKDVSNDDISTAFYTNLIVAVIVYIIIFLTAPLIAFFFKNQELVVLLRVLELMVVIDAFCAVQSSLLTRQMAFKKLTQYKITAIIVAAIISISCAILGLSIWALIIQYLIYSLLRLYLLWRNTTWKPNSFLWKKDSFKSMFGYGSKLLLSTLIADLYNNFQSILIGRKFPMSELGFYTQAQQLQQIPVGSLSRTVNTVAFPAYSQIQDDKEQFVNVFRKNLIVLVFINTPLMVLLSVIAKPLLVILYSEKWIGSVPYFQFLCLGIGILSIVHQCSRTALSAAGRSDYVLKLEIIKKAIGVGLLIIGIQWYGIYGVMIALSLTSMIEFVLNNYYLHKIINYGFFCQVKDIFPYLFLSCVAGYVSYLVIDNIAVFSFLSQVSIITMLYCCVYMIGCQMLKLDGYIIILRIVKSSYRKNNRY